MSELVTMLVILILSFILVSAVQASDASFGTCDTLPLFRKSEIITAPGDKPLIMNIDRADCVIVTDLTEKKNSGSVQFFKEELSLKIGFVPNGNEMKYKIEYYDWVA